MIGPITVPCGKPDLTGQLSVYHPAQIAEISKHICTIYVQYMYSMYHSIIHTNTKCVENIICT